MILEIKIEVEAVEAAKVLLILKTADNAKIVDWLTEMIPKEKKP